MNSNRKMLHGQICEKNQPQFWTEVPHPYFEGDRWGYINNRGKSVIPPQFAFAGDFFERRAAVRGDKRWGYIRTDGSWAVVLPEGAQSTRRFSEERAWFYQDKKYGCVDAEGSIVISPRYDWALDFSEGLAVVAIGPIFDFEAIDRRKTRWGFVNKRGGVAIPLQYTSAGSFGNGFAYVSRHDTHNFEFVNRNGEFVPLFENVIDDAIRIRSVHGFSCGLLRFSISGVARGSPTVGFLDVQGQLLGNRYWDWASSFSEGLAAVKISGQIGYIDTSGVIVIPPVFDEGRDFHEGVCLVWFKGAWRYIDRKGNVVAENRKANCGRWGDAEDFHGGLARVHIGGDFVETLDGPQWWEGGAWHYINRHGNVVALCRIDREDPADRYFGKELPAP